MKTLPTSPLDRHARPVPFSPMRFEAFRVDRNYGGGQPVTFTEPFGSLEEAQEKAKLACNHRDHLAIRETDTLTGETRLHIFVIRKARPKWIHPAGEFLPRRVEDLYAAPVCVLSGEVINGKLDSKREAA